MRAWLVLAFVLIVKPVLAGPQDAWIVDHRASSLGFAVTQIGSVVSGRLPAWTGEIILDPAAPAAARIDISIDMRAVTTDNRDVDSLLKGENFFDVRKFPQARFVSTSVIAAGADRYEARGKLTIRDVTRDATLPFTLAITESGPQAGTVRATARGRMILKRLDYGVGRNEWASTGQVGNEVTIDLDVVASRPR